MNVAVSLLELTSIARGHRVADAMVKKAPVRLLDLGIVSPGKYLIVVSGDVGSVEEAYLEGLQVGGEWLIDQLFLPQPHDSVVQALSRTLPVTPIDALGIVETFSAISAVRSADVALKAADVALLELHYQKHLGGKGYFTVSGEQYSVEAALEAAVSSLRDSGQLLTVELIARPHEDFTAHLSGAIMGAQR